MPVGKTRGKRKAADTRFWAKVDKGDEDWHCWEWTVRTNYHGYGEFSLGGKTTKAHRFAYRLACKHPIEPEVVMHLCHNRRCVNPLHLKGGTQKDNMSDRNHREIKREQGVELAKTRKRRGNGTFV